MVNGTSLGYSDGHLLTGSLVCCGNPHVVLEEMLSMLNAKAVEPEEAWHLASSDGLGNPAMVGQTNTLAPA